MVMVMAGLITSVVGVANAAVQVNGDHAAFASAARPARQPSVTPQMSALPGATPTPALTAATLTAIGCAIPTVSFNGEAYCPATIGAVRGTLYGTGVRVVLKGVTVTAVATSSVTVAAWATPPCTPGKYCGQLLTLQSLNVAWSGTNRPAYGDVLNLFGRTIPTSITPVGYVKTGWCPIDWC